MASDRRLTFVDGNGLGAVKTDNECKLVSLCHHSCIGYTGISRIAGCPTHEWIAKTLAAHGCRDGMIAAQILATEASKALKNFHKQYGRTTFLIVGWQDTNHGLLPYLARISNAYNDDESYRHYADDEFKIKGLIIDKDVPVYQAGVGVLLHRAQNRRLARHLKQIYSKGNLPVATLRVLKDEIINSSDLDKSVGNKILGVSIPKASVEKQKLTGTSFMLATQPNTSSSTFTYFERGYSQLIQYGPTVACGRVAHTTVETTKDEKSLSVTIKMLTSSSANSS